jgi:oxygen-dependent protoporphyrinogen oxidase
MPQYTVGHLSRVAAVEAAMAGVPGIVLTGATYRGVGIPDCVVQGRSAARRLGASLGGSPMAPSEATEPPSSRPVTELARFDQPSPGSGSLVKA